LLCSPGRLKCSGACSWSLLGGWGAQALKCHCLCLPWRFACASANSHYLYLPGRLTWAGAKTSRSVLVWETNLHKNFNVVRYSVTKNGLLTNNRFRFKGNVVKVKSMRKYVQNLAPIFYSLYQKKHRKTPRIMHKVITLCVDCSLQLLFQTLFAPASIWWVTRQLHLRCKLETHVCL
jgi:hypothetical protein